MAISLLTLGCHVTLAADITFYSYSDSHYGADGGGKRSPKTRCAEVDIINSLPGVAYPRCIDTGYRARTCK
jgi:hypothetical protein